MLTQIANEKKCFIPIIISKQKYLFTNIFKCTVLEVKVSIGSHC